MQRALALALAEYPNIRFASSQELGDAIRRADPNWLETRFAGRLECWINRLREVPRLRKLAWATGLIVPVLLAYVFGRLARPARTQ